MATLLLIEDDPSIRTSLTAALEDHGHQVLARSHGADLTSDLLAKVDLAIVDLSLPHGPDGLQLSRMLRAERDMPVIILTAQDGLESKAAGYGAGADLYVTKPFSVVELQFQISALLRRARPTARPLTAGTLTLDPAQRIAWREGDQLALTPTEFALLDVLVRHADQALSKPQLLQLAWGDTVHDDNLVETTIRRLRRKLGNPDPIETIRGVGYRLVTRP
jgi:DNA-binding response OmpR family regulator